MRRLPVVGRGQEVYEVIRSRRRESVAYGIHPFEETFSGLESVHDRHNSLGYSQRQSGIVLRCDRPLVDDRIAFSIARRQVGP